MNASAMVKARVARVRWLISVLEKCQIEPVCTGMGRACSSKPNIRTKGAPEPVAWTRRMCGWRQLPSSLAALWLPGEDLLSNGSSSSQWARGSLSAVIPHPLPAVPRPLREALPKKGCASACPL